MKTLLLIGAAIMLVALLVSGCTAQVQQTPKQTELSPQDSAEAVNSLDQTFADNTQDVKIGQMV